MPLNPNQPTNQLWAQGLKNRRDPFKLTGQMAHKVCFSFYFIK